MDTRFAYYQIQDKKPLIQVSHPPSLTNNKVAEFDGGELMEIRYAYYRIQKKTRENGTSHFDSRID